MDMPRHRRLATAFALVALIAGCDGGDDNPPAPPPPAPPPPAAQVACADLAGIAIPAAEIALPTNGGTVTAAAVVAASGSGATALPEYCAVSGTLSPVDPAAPPIKFSVALPTEWNTKAMMFGGGGFDGSIPSVTGNVPAGPADQPTPLGRGYATFGSDSGHQANAFGSQDASSFVNDEALQNFIGDALKKTHDAALFLIKQRYAAAPTRAYFAGGSTGGREALSVIQRWPADWDGAIAWYPAWNDLSALLFGQKLNRTMAQPGAYPNPAKRAALFQAAMQACDSLDGVVDGLINNQDACNGSFDPTTATLNGTPLRCPGGADTGDSCLSDAQIAAVTSLSQDARFNFTLASGETGYPGYNVWGSDLGMTSTSPLEPTVTFLALGTVAPADPMPLSGGPYVGQFLDQWMKYAVTRDPSFHSLTIDPENPGPWASRLSDLSIQLDTPTDISAFVAKGGKLLLAHGKSDVLVSTKATEMYYQRLQRQFGASAVEDFARYYEVPGYGHAVSSVFNAAWDSVTALEGWVENGTAPEAQVVTDTAGVPGRTRPLCDYPQFARYKGSGDVNLAASFTCGSS
jgi:feruloyl esterase